MLTDWGLAFLPLTQHHMTSDDSESSDKYNLDAYDPDGSGLSSGGDTSDEDSPSGLESFATSMGNASTRGGGGHSPTWTGKLDLGSPYVVVVEDRQGNVYAHKGASRVVDNPKNWKRSQRYDYKDEDERTSVDEEMKAEYRELFKQDSRTGWLVFCNRAKDQLGVDPNEVLDEEPERLHFLEEKVHIPRSSMPDKSRTCQVCGVSSAEHGTTVLELDLTKHRNTPVCAEHTVEELAKEGLLE